MKMISTTPTPAFRTGAAPPARASRRGGVLQGCLVAVAIVVALLVAGGIFVYMNWRGWAASGMTTVAEAALAESGLTADQQQAVQTQIDQLAGEFKDGKVTLEQLGSVIEIVAESPLLAAGAAMSIENMYITPSDMTAEEKAAGALEIQRVARGLFEKKINKQGLEDVIKPVVTLMSGGNGNWRFKETATRAEVDQMIANAKAKADAASIPVEPFTFDLGAELKTTIDQALGRAG